MDGEDIVYNWLNVESQLEIIKSSFKSQHFRTAYREAERLARFLRIFAIRDMKKEANHE